MSCPSCWSSHDQVRGCSNVPQKMCICPSAQSFTVKPFNCLHLAVNHISLWFLIIWRLLQVPPTCVFCWPSLIVKDSDGKSNVFGPEFQLVSLVWQGGTPFSINLWSVKNLMHSWCISEKRTCLSCTISHTNVGQRGHTAVGTAVVSWKVELGWISIGKSHHGHNNIGKPCLTMAAVERMFEVFETLHFKPERCLRKKCFFFLLYHQRFPKMYHKKDQKKIPVANSKIGTQKISVQEP